MKNLIIASVIGIVLTIPSVSFAGVNAFGIETPVEKKEAGNNVRAGYVAKGLGDTFHVQKPAGRQVAGKSDEKDEYLVFGININSLKNRI